VGFSSVLLAQRRWATQSAVGRAKGQLSARAEADGGNGAIVGRVQDVRDVTRVDDDLQSGLSITIDLTDGATIDLTDDREHDEHRASAERVRDTSVGTRPDTEKLTVVVGPWPMDAIAQWHQAQVEHLPKRLRLPWVVLSRKRPAPTEQRSLSALYRTLDIVYGVFLLLLLLPVILVAAVAIKSSSRGPVLYRHERLGRDGKAFYVRKFRSMVVNADRQIEEARQAVLASNAKVVDAPTFKSEDDPRVTKVGRFLRRSGIDELPQLINVLLGEMSLVGPRPLVASEVEMLSHETASLRHSVRPGIICLWQVLRDEDTTFSERMQMDLLYSTRRSVSLDLAIIAVTPFALVRGSGTF
jgi:lipopolysaccharide/colanic/teichoic acid biosynthesis glycosyltransferase